jgi:hypothetical protein
MFGKCMPKPLAGPPCRREAASAKAHVKGLPVQPTVFKNARAAADEELADRD